MATTVRNALFAFLIAASTAIFAWAASAETGALPSPKGPAVLTIEGDIAITNQDGKAVFDIEMLDRLGLTKVVTRTPWYDDVVTFEGVSAAALMKAVGANGGKVVAIALNDYKADIPTSDFVEHGVIFATRRNGQPMPISDKGPIFVVYPYDADPDLHSQKYYSRSVWQLSRLIVRD